MIRQYQKDESQIYKNLAFLRKAFPPDSLSTIEDYVDLFLKYRGVRYRDYFLEFGLLLKERGFYYSSCEINELITDKLLNGNYKSFKLKKRNEIDKMNGREFEVFLARFFKKCGYQVDMTPRSHDKGSDLIIQINDLRTVVQAKRHKKNIGIKAVQEAYTAMGYYQTDKAMVIVSSEFSKHAREFAERLNVELWNRKRLMQKLNYYNFQI